MRDGSQTRVARRALNYWGILFAAVAAWFLVYVLLTAALVLI